MKKVIMVMIAALTVSSAAYAKDMSFSVEAKGGMTNSSIEPTEYTSVEDGNNYGLAVEARFLENWAVELQYLKSSMSYELGSMDTDFDLTSISLYGGYYFEFGNGLYIKPKAGISKNDGDASISYTEAHAESHSYYTRQYTYSTYTSSIDLSETEFSCGVSVGYAFNENFSVALDLVYLGEDLTTAEIGAKYTL